MKCTKIISFMLVLILGVGVLASCDLLNKKDDSDNDATTYVSLRVNPEIELLADEDGTVLAANAINEDGEVVLATITLEGKSVEEASAVFTETANDLGYFTPDGEKDTVYIDVNSTIEGEETKIKDKMDKSIRDYFSNNGINGKVSSETLDKYADKAAEWGISKGHVKLVMRVLDACPELTDTEVLSLSVKDLMKLLKGEKGEEKITAGLKAACRKEIDKLKDDYARLFELRAEIKALQTSKTDDLTEEEKAAIEAQIAEKEAEAKTLSQEYKAKAGQIKDSYKESSKEARKAYRAEAEKRKKEKKDKSAT